jgi:hypothetical protein
VKSSCGNAGRWKVWKTESRFSTLPTALGNRCRDSHIPTASNDCSYINRKAPKGLAQRVNNLGWAEINRRSGPSEVAKTMWGTKGSWSRCGQVRALLPRR